MSKDNKRKWEKEYEVLKTKNIDEEIKKLEVEVNEARKGQSKITDSNSDEYKQGKADQKFKEKELNKMKMLKINMPQIERTIKFRDAQKKKLEELNKQKKQVEETKKLSDEAKKLEEELEKLQKQEKEIKDLLKNPKLTDEKRKQLEEAQTKNAKAQTDNHMNFSKKQQDLTAILSSPLAKKDFDKEIQVTKNMISKSNFIGKNLMEGKRMEEISVDLKDWKDRKLTDKKKQTEAKKENSAEENKGKINQKKSDKKENKDKTDSDDLVSEIENAVRENIAREDENNKPAKVSEFDQKHPRIAAIKNFGKTVAGKAKELYGKVKSKFEKKDKKEETSKKTTTTATKTAENKEVKGKLSSEQIADKKAEFYKRLTETGKLSNLPTDGKMTEAIQKQEETIKSMSEDEGR